MFMRFPRRLCVSQLRRSGSCARWLRKKPIVECLEGRDLPAPLTWLAGPNLPTARGGLVAVSQGSAIAVLGGGVPDVLAVGVTDPTWKATIGAQASFGDPASISPGVGISGGIVLFGGNNGGAVPDTLQYSPGDGNLPLASMNTPRALLGYASDQQGTLYAIGGIDDSGTPLASMEYYTQGTKTWTYAAALPQTLYAESAVYDGNGHIFTFGGVGADGTITSNVYEYTVASNSWSQAASMPIAVRDSAAVLGSNNLIYVLGGNTSTGTTAAVLSYNPATKAWNTETALPSPVSNVAAVSDSLGRIEVIGGFDSNGNAVANVSITQELNQPDSAPTITTTAPTTAWTAGYTYQVLSTANPQATYSLTDAPDGMTIDSNTGLITWAPSQAQLGGTYTVAVQASNYAGQTTQTYSVTVKQSPPTVPSGVYQSGETVDSATLSWNPSTGPIGVDHYNVYHYYGTGHSGRDGGITYHYDLVGSSTTPSLTISGLLSGGTFSWYTITAVDANGLSSGYSSLYTIHTLPDTVPPTLTLPANQTVTATSPSGATDAGAFTATATDPGPGIDSISIVYVVGLNQIPTTYVFPIGTTTVTAIARDMYGNYTPGNFTVTVVSSFPVLSLPANQIVETQSSAGATDANAFTATATDPQDSIASITYAVNGTQIDPTYVFAPGTTTVTVTATDTSGYSTTGTFTVLVEDIPPTLTLAGLPTNNTVTEGTAINLTASGTAATSAENASGLNFTWNVSKTQNGVTTANFASGSGSGSSVPIAFTADDEGSYTLTVTDTDVNGASTTVTQTITSTIVAPTTGISGPGDGVTYQNRLFTLTASSPSPVDQANPFSFAINWGDGNTQTVTANSGVVVGHTYAATGTYSVSVTATDSGGTAGSTATQSIIVKAIENQNDPAGQGGSVGLAVGGTSGNDAFAVTTGTTSGTVSVSLNGTSMGTFTPRGRAIYVFGGPGTNRLTFKASSGAGAFSLKGSALGYSNSGTAVPLFKLSLNPGADIQSLVIQGGNAASTYLVRDTTIATTIVGGSGTNRFALADKGAATQPVTFNGGSGTNTLVGPNLSNTWTVTGVNAGTVQAGSEPADTFTACKNLIGGSGVDVFTFSSAGKVTSINGGGAPAKQGDWLNYSAFTSAVTVNLAKGSATNVNGGAAGSVRNIQNVHGGNGGNTLTGDAQGNILIGGSGANTIIGGRGRSLLIADQGGSKITGGSGGSAAGGDILIGGYTTYDTMTVANEAALMSILAEWQSADSYATRFNDSNSGTGGGLNGTNQLSYGTTVFDNTRVNTLTAQAGTAAVDWFFANTAAGHSTIYDFETGEHLNNS